MKDVFISYVTPNLETAEQVYSYLTHNGFSCFFAPEDMVGGHPYGEELVQAMKNCRVQLLLYSDVMNVRKKNILAELDIAWKNDIPCLCVMLDDSDPGDGIAYYITSGHTIFCNPNRMKDYLPKIADALKSILPKKTDPLKSTSAKNAEVEEPVEEAKPTTVFDYDPVNGLMINPADGERNVSFRTDTFINMMGGIYEKVAIIAGVENAGKIFFESGYESGKNFAARINSKWGNGFSLDEMKKKIQKWCAFDSVVGWGKFEADIQFDEENDTFGGTLTITEAFIVDTQHKRKVCEFIRGYCTGVLDTLLGDLDVELVCASCRLEKKLSRKCVFEIKMKG